MRRRFCAIPAHMQNHLLIFFMEQNSVYSSCNPKKHIAKNTHTPIVQVPHILIEITNCNRHIYPLYWAQDETKGCRDDPVSWRQTAERGNYMARGKETVQQAPLSIRLKRNFIRYKYIYVMLLPIIIYYAIFCYGPMGSIVIAFQNFKPALGISGSKWVGFKHFVDFFTGPYAWRLIRNTLTLNILQILFGFPIPIIVALLINEIRCKTYKKFVQTVSYMPHFISLVVMCSLLLTFSRSDGIFNDFLSLFGIPRTNLMANSALFRPMFVLSGIWQEAGWGSIIYLATLSTIDPGLYEAATIDGANRLQRMLYVSFPGLVPIIIVQLIMRVGNILTMGFEKVFLLYNPLTYDTADIISTFIYRQGLELTNYSFGTAVGLFNSVVNLVILVAANYISKKTTEESLW